MEQTSKSLWQHAWESLKKDKAAVFSMAVITIYVLIALLTLTGVIASDWSKEVGGSYLPPSGDNFFGTDIFGRSVVL